MRADQLPTKAQIAALTDVEALRGLQDDVERATITIQAQLDNLDDPDGDWRTRAVNALALHQYTARLLARRIQALTPAAPGAKKPAARRPPEDCNPLTREALQRCPSVDPASLKTTQDCDGWWERLTAIILAMSADREDEIAMAAGDRDEGFLSATGRVLAELKHLRQRVQTRRGAISKEETRAFNADRETRRERLFIDCARELLPQETYQMLWAAVDRREVAQSLESAHA